MAAPLIAAAIISSMVGAKSRVDASRAEQKELMMQAEQEELAARQRQLQRTSELNRVLSQNILRGAASGIGFEGSPQAIGLATSRDIAMGEQAESLSMRLRKDQLRRQRKSMKQASEIGAFASVAGSMFSVMQSGISPGKKGGGG